MLSGFLITTLVLEQYYLVERPFLRLTRRRGAPDHTAARGFAPAPPGLG